MTLLEEARALAGNIHVAPIPRNVIRRLVERVAELEARAPIPNKTFALAVNAQDALRELHKRAGVA